MKLTDKLLGLLFPERVACLSCGREAVVNDSGLCSDCEVGVERFISAPVIEDVSGFTAAYVYNDVSGRMVKRLKYNNAKYLAPYLADAVELPKEWKIDAVISVPLHKKRVAQRGYNQSELIAKHLCRRTGLPLRKDLLTRIVDTKQQARLSLAGRMRNLKGAFRADDACKGLNVLLVDDVRTTGATIAECAKELKKHGCGSVYAAAVCFAKHDKGVSV